MCVYVCVCGQRGVGMVGKECVFSHFFTGVGALQDG